MLPLTPVPPAAGEQCGVSGEPQGSGRDRTRKDRASSGKTLRDLRRRLRTTLGRSYLRRREPLALRNASFIYLFFSFCAAVYMVSFVSSSSASAREIRW